MNAMCPHCEKINEVRIESVKEEYEIKGLKVSIDAERSVCTACGRDFATKEQMEKTTRAGYDAYREVSDIISPEEIILLREKYGTSQKVFAKILDLGELTINSYEQGAIVSKSISNLVRLMENTDNFTELFNKKRTQLSKTQIHKIETALEHQIISIKDSRLFFTADKLDKVKNVEGKYTGYNRPDLEKLLCLIQLMILLAGKELYKMAILKILFYIDFAAFKKTTLSITGWPYARLPLGPAPNEYKDILRVGEDNSYFISRPDENEIGELFSLLDSFHEENVNCQFDKEYLEIIKTVVGKLKDKTPTELKNLTHKERAWKETAHAALIDYSLANELILF